MRPGLALSLGTAATIFFVAGCTFLISFDDAPDAGALADDDDDTGSSSGKKSSSSSSGGTSSSSSSSGTDTSSSSSSSSSGSTTKIPPECDPAFDREAIDCTGYTRPNCGSEPGLLQGAATESDLIDCTGGGTPTCVRHCPHGCSKMPAGHNDSCDECFDKDDGWYCGKDLRGDWGPDDGMAIHCVGHVQTESAVCGAGKCATVCPETSPSDARPSCCTP
jgi:hypothetical protein